MDKYYTVSMVMVVLSMLIMLISVKFNIGLAKKRRQASAIFFGFIIIGSLCEWTGVMLDGTGASLIFPHILVKTIELSLAPFIGLLCGKSFSDSKWEKLIFCILSLNVVLEICSAFTGLIFYVDDANVYHHGPLYFIYLLSYVIGIIYYVGRGISISRKFPGNYGISIYLTVIFIVACIVTQLIDSKIRIDWLAISMGAMMLYKFYGDMLLQIDGLTELLNHWSYEHTIQSLSGKAVIIFFDVDKFKGVNDKYGHAIGDECLQKVAASIQKVYGSHGMCFRYGGDEFCVIMNHSLNRVDKITDEFLEIINQLRQEYEWMPCVSFGYARYDAKEDDIHDVMRQADEAMYRYKNGVI